MSIAHGKLMRTIEKYVHARIEADASATDQGEHTKHIEEADRLYRRISDDIRCLVEHHPKSMGSEHIFNIMNVLDDIYTEHSVLFHHYTDTSVQVEITKEFPNMTKDTYVKDLVIDLAYTFTMVDADLRQYNMSLDLMDIDWELNPSDRDNTTQVFKAELKVYESNVPKTGRLI